MMRRILLFLLLSIPALAFSQENQPYFAARAQLLDAPGDLGGDLYRLTLIITDETAVYDGLDILADSTFFYICPSTVYGEDINLYPIINIITAFAGQVTVDVRDIGSVGPPTAGSNVVGEASPAGLFAYVSGAGDPLNQAISDYNIDRVLTRQELIDSLGTFSPATMYTGGTFTLGSTHDLLEDAIASYSTRFRSQSIGTWLGVTSDTANNKLGLRWSTLQGTHEVMSSLSGLQLLSGSDMTFKLSNGLKRFYFDGGVDTDNTNTQALSVDPVTKELELVDLYQPVAGRNVEISGDTINANTDVGRRLFVDKANYTGTPVPGDPAQPFRDPWQAIDSFQVGDIIEVLAGTYIAVDSARIGTYPGYDVIVTQEDRYRYNFMSKDQTYFLFRPGTKIQWSALESYLAWDTLGYSMKMVGDVVIETTEEGGNIFVLNDNDNVDQPSNLEVEVESIIGQDTGPSTSGKPTLFYLANGNNVQIKVDQIDGLYRLVYYDGLYGVNNSNVHVGRWLCDFGDYNIQIGGDTLRNQNHQIRIDFVNIADHDYIFFETNRTYYWDNTNFKLSIGQLLADRVNINTTRGGFDSEGLVYALLGGAFWDNAIHLQNSNFIFECENYYGNVPLLQMIYAPNATQTDNFNFEFRGNYVYHTDYIGSTGTQPLFGPRSWTPPPGFQVTLNGTFVTQDTVNLISTRIGDVRLQGLFKNAGSEPVVNIETESNGTVELLNAHLVNDGTAPEVTAEDAKTVFLRTRWEPSNVDTNVVFQRYPLYATNPYLGANTVQGSIDSLYANMGAGGGGITLDTVLVQSDTLIDWNSKNFKVIQLDMTSVTSITLEFANPTDPLFGTLQFRDVSGTDSVTFPGNVYWMDETSVGTLNITQSGKYTMIYDGTNYYME